MGYIEALETAGAEILFSKWTGSYEGQLYVIVDKGEGPQGLVIHYGSCSGCDDYEATFGYKDVDKDKLKKFGESYLEGTMTMWAFCNYIHDETTKGYGSAEAVELKYELIKLGYWADPQKTSPI